ncbi:hypothetical protein HK105_201769 [Polyrhizophydium stewartii]|uniref:VWFA domain-containing protein n=1 Tax=Polyrhizophydium stewartii TaxID=2732419 RepID=A0ABR4NHC5_9FUNG|nr:hypothetical protein HK105_002800 [Polyrhizophydium stewartii]
MFKKLFGAKHRLLHRAGKRSLAARAAELDAAASAATVAAVPDTEATQLHQQVAAKLARIVADNRLQAWYNEASLRAVVQRLANINFVELARRMRLSPEAVLDLCSLALFDVVFFIDDSGSMTFEGGSRINDLKFILSRTAHITTLFDDDGVRVRFINSLLESDGVATEERASRLIDQVDFCSGTPIGTNFKKKVLDPMVLEPARAGRFQKPVLAIIITDGEPTLEPADTLRKVILDAKNALSRTKYGPGALAIQIGQVGTDLAAQAFLAQLDNDPEVGNMIDCTSNYEMESEEFMAKGEELTPELWLMKLCIGAVDRGYDNTD